MTPSATSGAPHPSAGTTRIAAAQTAMLLELSPPTLAASAVVQTLCAAALYADVPRVALVVCRF
jgi:hypothetical protein